MYQNNIYFLFFKFYFLTLACQNNLKTQKKYYFKTKKISKKFKNMVGLTC